MSTENIDIPESPDREQVVQNLQQTQTNVETETKSESVPVPDDKPAIAEETRSLAR